MAESKSPIPPFISQQVRGARRFYLNLRPARSVDLAIVCGGWEDCAPDYAIDRPTFPFHSIEFVAAGGGELVLGGTRHELTPGTIFSYGPGVHHRIRCAPRQPLRKYFVDFAGRRARPILRQAGLAPGTVVQVGAGAAVRRAFDELIDTASAYDRFSTNSARLQFELLTLFIRRAAQAGPAAEAAARTFERCREYIETQYRTIRTVAEVAARCHLDVAYLTRLFRRFQGETPFRYLQRLQFQWAAERLQSTGCLVKTVADELGVDPFQFSRSFRRIYGVSPSEFVQSHRGRG